MWLATKYGFFSIVKKSGNWHLRSRTVSDLTELKAAVSSLSPYPIQENIGTDYAARLLIPENETPVMTDLFLQLLQSIDYPNFKSKIGATPSQCDKLNAYHSLWDVMFEYQSKKNKKK